MTDDAPAGLTEAQREALRDLGLPDAPEVAEALAVPLERGHHLAVLAGEGSGKEVLYGLAAALRADPTSPEPQALILTPTAETAARAARAAYALCGAEGLEVLAWPPEGARGGEAPGGEEAEPPLVHVLAGRPERLLAEVRRGRLKLGQVKLLALDGVRALGETGAWPAVEALVDSVEGEVQRIAVSDRVDERLEALLRGRLPRARRWPPELFPRDFEPEEGEPGGRAATAPSADEPALLCASAVGAEERFRALAHGLRRLAERTGEERAFVHCPDGPEAHRTAAALSVSGFRLSDGPEEPGVVVGWGDEAPPEGVACAHVGLPPGLEALRRRLGPGSGRLAVVEPGHVPQLELLARRAGWRLRALAPPPSPGLLDEVERFRDTVRKADAQSDAATSLLLLEPLMEELGPARLASALTALARGAGAAGEAAAGAADEEPAPATGREADVPDRRPGRAASAPRRRAERASDLVERSLRPSWTRIFVNVGKRDGAGPGDLVGAITGETSVAGAQIGKIEVRDTYSLVDLDSQVVDDVLAGLSGARIKGREVSARRDRQG